MTRNMSKIIRQALAERLLKSPRAAAFIRDFSAASGLPLRFSTPLGVELEVANSVPEPLVCRWMKSDPARATLCARSAQEGMLQASMGKACDWQCSVGLREAAVPLKMGGEIFGFLVIGQVACRPLDLLAINRWRHALERIGQKVTIQELESMAQSVQVMPEERFRAVVRLLEWAAVQFISQVEESIAEPVENFSPPIRKAVRFIQTHFEEPLTLGQVAKEVGMSREHFCTQFHRGTGLRFVEYLTRIRIDRAKELLRTTDASVLEVSLACGFQTISHFNRRFQTLVGKSPTAFRKESVQGN